jgi:prophage maintenance system killer protein
VIDQAAVLCWHLVNDHGLSDGNKRCAIVAMVVFLRRNDVVWTTPSTDDAVATMLAVASQRLDVAGLAGCIRSHAESTPVIRLSVHEPAAVDGDDARRPCRG